ncbi:MAG: PIN domain-containing protein [Mucilaginibacter sp.]
MRALLDTNIIIHREASHIQNEDIGVLFYWLDKLKIDKCIHPATSAELNKFKDKAANKAMNVKIENYHTLKTTAAFDKRIQDVSDNYDKSENDRVDTQILNEVYAGRVDFLITEDNKIHKKADLLGIGNKVFKIDEYLEKALAENPELINYKVLAVKKAFLGEVNIQDQFFDSFRADYKEFDAWYNKKADEYCYVCYYADTLSAFLYVKIEDGNENYSDISPIYPKKKRLKIGTFKVTTNGFKIGERFLKIIFDNARVNKVHEIYVTIFDRTTDQKRLISLLENFGFIYFGEKSTSNGIEKVFTKQFSNVTVNPSSPKLTYPFILDNSDVYIVPIYPQYHTELFPDSILRTESPKDFVENEPHRNAISKVYVSRSWVKNLQSGDRIVFYRTGNIHTGVVTTVGVVESVITEIPDENTFIQLCRKRSVFTDDELRLQWQYNPNSRPFIVNFLYVGSFKKRPNLKWLTENGVIPDILDMPRGFRKISQQDFNNIVQYSKKK